ncbi:DUF533 domain-containing protein [Arenimonas fontis]|nr:DUF533 domain-containing protein [Arenimonas fontis]
MFDPERLLGQMLGDALDGRLGGRRRKRSTGVPKLSGSAKAQIGLGLLGVAMAAWEHYKGSGGHRHESASASPAGLQATGPGAAVPPPPPPGAYAARPGAGTVVPPPPPPGAATPPPATRREQEALHLLRAMIAAAHADGLIDEAERQAIMGRAREAGMEDDDLRMLEAEIRAPFTLEQLAARTLPGQETAVYAAALLAAGAETEQERAFLDRLGKALSLDEASRRDIHVRLGAESA